MNRSGNKHEHERASYCHFCERSLTTRMNVAKMWDPLRAQFIDRLDEVNKELRDAGLPEIKATNINAGMKKSEQ